MNAHAELRPAEAAFLTAPLDRLDLDPANIRRDGAGDDLEPLAASIRESGLLQNLVVRLDADGETLRVVAGGRRLRALRLLAERGEIAPDFPVPCQLRDGAEATPDSLTENLIRQQMSAADEIAAFCALSGEGRSVEEIAARFGATARHVKGRLALARLAPEVLAALRAGEVSLDQCKAFAARDDHDRQRALLEECARYRATPAHIRARMVEDWIAPDDRLAVFVGEEAYRAAGGAVAEDLFSEDVRWTDPALLRRLADERLGGEAKRLCDAEGWGWVQGYLEDAPHAPAIVHDPAFTRLEPTVPEIVEADAARYDELALILEADPEDAEARAELEALEDAFAPVWSAEQKARSGVALWIGWDGALRMEAGIIEREKVEDAEPATAPEAPDHAEREEYGPKPLYTHATRERLTILRRAAYQAALAQDFRAAFDLATFELIRRLDARPRGRTVLDIHPRASNGAGYDHADLEGAFAPLAEIADALPLDWLDEPDPVAQFAAFAKLAKAKKEALFAYAIAVTATMTLSDAQAEPHPVCDAIGARIGANIRRVWTPDAAFFGKLRKDQLLDIGAAIMGASFRTAQGGAKKAALADAVAALFTNGTTRDAMTDDQRAAADAWRPEGSAF